MGGDEKRMMLALVIAMAVLFLYPYFMGGFFPQPLPVGEAEQKEVVSGDQGSESITGERIISLDTTGASSAESKTRNTAVVEKPREIKEVLSTVETPLFIATFTNIGGGIKSWKLKNYSSTQEEGSEKIDIVKTVVINSIEKTPFETRIDISGMIEKADFKASKSKIVISKEDSATLRFSWTSPKKVAIEKTYTFTGDGYIVNSELVVKNNSRESIKGAIWTDIVATYGDDDSYYHHGPLRNIKGDTERQDLEISEESGRTELNWIALEDKYFLQAILPKEEDLTSWQSIVPAEKTAQVSVAMPINLSSGFSQSMAFDTYIGPKEYNRLLEPKVKLEHAIEFGFFDFLAKPFLVALNFLKKYLWNYGIAIVVLTIIIKILFYPLTKHSMKSMKEMQRINPQMKALKEKYKDDKNKMNKELMELYKRYKVNPISGCLPMILQLPVFVALYEVFYVAIELRHAPFYLWIHDLAAADPYYVTPVLMGITMFIHQKMTPSMMDPLQAKIMLMMPIVLTFVFLKFPAGLVLYWLTNNILSIIQQYFIYREKPGTGRPAIAGSSKSG
jgi:YidC/Oxa1 family membrane protein insertase